MSMEYILVDEVNRIKMNWLTIQLIELSGGETPISGNIFSSRLAHIVVLVQITKEIVSHHNQPLLPDASPPKLTPV